MFRNAVGKMQDTGLFLSRDMRWTELKNPSLTSITIISISLLEKKKTGKQYGERLPTVVTFLYVPNDIKPEINGVFIFEPERCFFSPAESEVKNKAVL